jgi:hypothetical protein
VLLWEVFLPARAFCELAHNGTQSSSSGWLLSLFTCRASISKALVKNRLVGTKNWHCYLLFWSKVVQYIKQDLDLDMTFTSFVFLSWNRL